MLLRTREFGEQNVICGAQQCWAWWGGHWYPTEVTVMRLVWRLSDHYSMNQSKLNQHVMTDDHWCTWWLKSGHQTRTSQTLHRLVWRYHWDQIRFPRHVKHMTKRHFLTVHESLQMRWGQGAVIVPGGPHHHLLRWANQVNRGWCIVTMSALVE